MYLSRVEVATRDALRMRELTHLGAYHNWVEQSFPLEIQNGVRLRHLWRIDRLAGKTYLLLVSEDQPNLKQLEVHGVPGTAMSKDYDSFLTRIQSGQIFQFRLTANPSYAVPQAGKKNSKIYPHITVAQQKRWLQERQARLGFEFLSQEISLGAQPSFEIVDREWHLLRRHTGRKTVKLSSVTFEGMLKVVDATKFKDALTHGIGREKAFGMGLMTVIPRG